MRSRHNGRRCAFVSSTGVDDLHDSCGGGRRLAVTIGLVLVEDHEGGAVISVSYRGAAATPAHVVDRALGRHVRNTYTAPAWASSVACRCVCRTTYHRVPALTGAPSARPASGRTGA